jgi:hypothetical protein
MNTHCLHFKYSGSIQLRSVVTSEVDLPLHQSNLKLITVQTLCLCAYIPCASSAVTHVKLVPGKPISARNAYNPLRSFNNNHANEEKTWEISPSLEQEYFELVKTPGQHEA